MSIATASDPSGGSTRDEEFTFLFAQLVMQQSNMAMMLMGKTAHPETGAVIKEVEAPRYELVPAAAGLSKAAAGSFSICFWLLIGRFLLRLTSRQSIQNRAHGS